MTLKDPFNEAFGRGVLLVRSLIVLEGGAASLSLYGFVDRTFRACSRSGGGRSSTSDLWDAGKILRHRLALLLLLLLLELGDGDLVIFEIGAVQGL
mmetsp:Transcript_16499/g.28018  ORF Transcript_16499/g.28018 Transcript_16499/m.28018 type:complete len:96 (-) Transcript_16499:463-750(-)|eukprot:CAMPEP_0168624732 /NCGR_PEP_ID=MMETSP0449_2-20121227/9592_1 /TAXON_ID=1082188 /ORGANISM="Strombidium rassoulzadegani, Strain ras09" /LENGTH=95 /DNA_ID=CAMNT_0008666353 /DNA_START=92 /DNA_END=379 /DNA_ORIENTATION=+